MSLPLLGRKDVSVLVLVFQDFFKQVNSLNMIRENICTFESEIDIQLIK